MTRGKIRKEKRRADVTTPHAVQIELEMLTWQSTPHLPDGGQTDQYVSVHLWFEVGRPLGLPTRSMLTDFNYFSAGRSNSTFTLDSKLTIDDYCNGNGNTDCWKWKLLFPRGSFRFCVRLVSQYSSTICSSCLLRFILQATMISLGQLVLQIMSLFAIVTITRENVVTVILLNFTKWVIWWLTICFGTCKFHEIAVNWIITIYIYIYICVNVHAYFNPSRILSFTHYLLPRETLNGFRTINMNGRKQYKISQR